MYDYLVLGSGMGGLTVASLLARAGKRVCVVEAHEHPGGCAHSFPMGRYTFCAAVHYIFYCGEGEPVFNFLRKLGLEKRVTFERLDPEGYDHFHCPGEGLSFRIPSGLDKWADRLIDRFPGERRKINRFFSVVHAILDELRELPFLLSWRDYLTGPLRFPHVLRYLRWTLQHLFDSVGLPPAIQAILATQTGDLGLPPDRVSLLIYAGLIQSYCSGAYHPTRHFNHFIDTIVGVIQEQPGCCIEYNAEVCAIEIDDRQAAVTTRDGRRFEGQTLISNIDPRACVEMIGRERFPRRFLRQVDYGYSTGSFTIYLGLRGLDLRQHGFGNWNVWHYPHFDINRIFHAQMEENDLSDPGLFFSTPTLCASAKDGAICPDGEQILEIVTLAGHAAFHEVRHRDKAEYRKRKRAIVERMLDIVEAHYVPNLRKHIVMKFAGTPTTNVRYLWAPAGNIYGSELSPKNIHFGRLKYRTPLPNLFFTGASAEFPSVGGTVLGGCRLYTHLTGDPVNPARDLYGLL